MNPKEAAKRGINQLREGVPGLATKAKDAGVNAAAWSIDQAARMHEEDERIRLLRQHRPFTDKLAAPVEWFFRKVPLFGSILSVSEGLLGQTMLSGYPLTYQERIGRVAGAVSLIPFTGKAAETWAGRTFRTARALRTGDHEGVKQEALDAGKEITRHIINRGKRT